MFSLKNKVNYLGNRSGFFKDYKFAKRRPSYSTILAAKPVAFDPIPAELTKCPRHWKWGFGSREGENFSEMSAKELAEKPYNLLNAAPVKMGWLVEKFTDKKVEISHEGTPRHLVFAFEIDQQLYCMSWIIDFSGFYGDDGYPDTALMKLEVGDSIPLLMPDDPNNCMIFLALGQQIGGHSWNEYYKCIAEHQDSKLFSYRFIATAINQLELELKEKGHDIRELLKPYQPISFKQTISQNLLNRIDYDENIFPYLKKLHEDYY